MKRWICPVLIVCLLLCGCQLSSDRIKEPVTFYYIRRDYQQELSCVIASEEREAAGHREDLSYLMALYLMGPISEHLAAPLPLGTRIHVTSSDPQNVELSLSDTEKTMTDAQFSLACACLSYTCMDITDAQQVTLRSGSRCVTMTRENLILTDTSMEPKTEETK